MPSGRRKTQAYKAFEANIERSRAFLRIFDKEPDGGRKQGQPTKDEKELLRGSLVFAVGAVGALDAYLSDLILEIVPAYAPKSEKLTTALRAIANLIPAWRCALPWLLAIMTGRKSSAVPYPNGWRTSRSRVPRRCRMLSAT
jgi:hypothetical protein